MDFWTTEFWAMATAVAIGVMAARTAGFLLVGNWRDSILGALVRIEQRLTDLPAAIAFEHFDQKDERKKDREDFDP